MSWGKVIVAGAELREELVVSRSGSGLTVTGQESHPPSTRAAVQAAYDNLVAVQGLVVPVEFTDKVGLTAFYRVAEVRAELSRYHNGSAQAVTWSATLDLIGTGRDCEIESRVPTIGRLTDLAGPPAPVYWHAPAIGYTSYFTGLTVPSGSVTRLSEEGPVIVFTGIPAGVSPRWTVPVADYLSGAARLFIDTLPRIGIETPPSTVWQVDNGVVKIEPGANGAVTVSCWDPQGGPFAVGGWASAKDYAVQVGGVSQTSQPELTVLRNDPEAVTVRLTYAQTTGRVALDLTVRRGSRFVEGVVKRHAATTLGITRTAAEAASAVTGGLRATAADADGNRFVIGSAKVATTTTATASLSKASTTILDFFVGHEVGSPAAAGDAFADLLGQYLGSTGERARIVRR